MPFSMSNNSKHIINNLQELAKKPKYEYEWYNKIFESMQNVDGGVLKEVVDFFLGLELENLQELKDSCNDLQEIQIENLEIYDILILVLGILKKKEIKMEQVFF